MLQRMLLETVWGRSILVFTALGILSRMITILSYKRMKRAAENPATTKKQWVQLLKKRYESYERFGKVNNVEAFVEHYFSRKGILGVPLAFWDKAGIFLAVMTGFIGILGAGTFLNSMMTGNLSAFDASLLEKMLEAGINTGNQIGIPIAGYLILGSISATILLALHILSNPVYTRRQILVALTDYLENGVSKNKSKEQSEEKSTPPARDDAVALAEAAVTEEERQVLEEVLEEYFW